MEIFLYIYMIIEMRSLLKKKKEVLVLCTKFFCFLMIMINRNKRCFALVHLCKEMSFILYRHTAA